jgi:drug/metabolite transporter (DMT)-like permease
MTSIIGEPATEQPAFSVLAKGFAWATLSVGILSGWFVVTRLGLSHHLGIWDVVALRFGEGAVLLTPTLLLGRSKLPLRAWLQGIPLAVLWGAPFILLVGTGLRLTSATVASSIAPALMPIFAGVFVWMLRGLIPRPVEISGYVLISVGLVVLVRSHASTEGRADPVGILSLIVAAAMWALYALRLKASAFLPLQATALICFWSAIFYVPFYIGLGLSDLSRASGTELSYQSVYQGFPDERGRELRVQSRRRLAGSAGGSRHRRSRAGRGDGVRDAGTRRIPIAGRVRGHHRDRGWRPARCRSNENRTSMIAKRETP